MVPSAGWGWGGPPVVVPKVEKKEEDVKPSEQTSKPIE